MGVKNEITQVREGKIGERERQGVRESRTAGETCSAPAHCADVNK